jgi:diaminopimelate epimerase
VRAHESGPGSEEATVRMTKHHGLGNDFLVALSAEQPRGFVADPTLAVNLCHRTRGIGADGLILALPPRNDRSADLRMLLFNSDGSEAEISGNGIRCLAQAVLRSEGRAEGALRIETAAGLREVEAIPTEDPLTMLVTVDMGVVTEGPAVPRGAVEWGAEHIAGLSVGNPHLVLHVADLASVRPEVDGPALESMVPGGVNVHFLAVDGPDRVRLTHWERGAGATQACGSGATVAAVAAHRWGLVGPRVEVQMPGGPATVDVGEPIRLTGPSTYIAEVLTP